MCGIVGLFLKTDTLESQLGTLTAQMLVTMTDRGPDSAGFAIYGKPKTGTKITLRGSSRRAVDIAIAEVQQQIDPAFVPIYRDTHAVLATSPDRLDDTLAIFTRHSEVDVVGIGRRMEIYKEVGLPRDVTARFDLPAMHGTHAIGHTRMATESAVTTDGAHPFSTGADQCLVHNGSLSNHNAVRRRLEREGLTFSTRNDSEVAAGYLTWRLREGASLKVALEQSLDDLDGFFTFVVGTERGFAVMRDPVACKPAVMAETDDYVAFGSEYRALVELPGIEAADVFEPEPATVYAWERQ